MAMKNQPLKDWSFHGAELQNLLKLFKALVDGRLAELPNIPIAHEDTNVIIY